jgi:hypothetical protein
VVSRRHKHGQKWKTRNVEEILKTSMLRCIENGKTKEA